MKKLYYIRHGLSVMNKQGLISGSTDTPLNDEGKEQAKLAGLKARSLDIDLIVCSPLSRALNTAQIIAQEIGLLEDNILLNSLFTERNFGSLEGAPWVAGRDLNNVAGAESVDELLNRAKEAFSYLESLNAQNILVVSHGAFGRALRAVLSGVPFDNHMVGSKNADIYELI